MRKVVCLAMSSLLLLVLANAPANAWWEPTEGEGYWSPNTSVPHSTTCDNWIPYKQKTRVLPLTNMRIVLSIPSQLQVANPVKLYYSLSGGARQTQTVNVSGLPGSQSAIFTIAGSLLPTGTYIDYAMELNILSGTGTPCSSGYAVLPTKYGFHSFASSSADESPTHAAETLRAMAQIKAGAGQALTNDATCTKFFVAPTPCEEYAAGEPMDLGILEQVVAPAGGGVYARPPAGCDGYSTHWWGRLPHYGPIGQNPDIGRGALAYGWGWRGTDPGLKSAFIQVHTRAAAASSAFAKNVPLELGFAETPVNDGGYDWYKADVTLNYTLQGRFLAYVVDTLSDLSGVSSVEMTLWARTAELNTNGDPIAGTIEQSVDPIYHDIVAVDTSLLKWTELEDRMTASGGSFRTYTWPNYQIDYDKWRAFYVHAKLSIITDSGTTGYTHAEGDFLDPDDASAANWAITTSSLYQDCKSAGYN